MAEGGLMNAAKQGGTSGAFIGFSVGAVRLYLDAPAFARKSDAIITAAARANPSLSQSALRALRPTPLPALFMTTAIYGGLGAVYMTTGAASESMRGKKDLWNGVIGALAAGSLVGIRSGSMYASGGAMAASAAMSAAVDLLDGNFGPMSNDILERRKALYRE